MDEFVLYIPETIEFTDEQFLALCEQNSHLRIEMDTEQNLIIMSPTGFDTGHFNSVLNYFFNAWNMQYKLGYVLDSSTGFKLPDGSMRAPDVAFILTERVELLGEKARKGFLPACPDFALELRSPTDTKKKLLQKMDSYLQNGCRLAWLIDPLDQEICIYRPSQEPEVIDMASKGIVLRGEDVLPNFELRVDDVFA